MIHLKSNKIVIPNSIVNAIKGYTAVGGELSKTYSYNADMQADLYKYVSNNRLEIKNTIYRKIDLNIADYESIFNKLYDTGSYTIVFDKLQSFRKNKHRVFTFGGRYQDYVLIQIDPGTVVHGLDISNISVYPQEEEVLLGQNKFKIYYKDIEWTKDNHLILVVE